MFKHLMFGFQETNDVKQLHIKELTLWAHLSHPNILSFYGVFHLPKDGKICLISPWMENGNLHEYSKYIPEHEKLSLVTRFIDVRVFCVKLILFFSAPRCR